LDSPNPDDTEAVLPEVRAQLLEPFLTAVSSVLAEMAGCGVAVQAVYRQARSRTRGELSAVLRLHFTTAAALVLSCPRPTARALAERVLAGTVERLDDALIGDCLGELGNVIAGQAKALLAGTPHHFTFATPTLVTGAGQEVGVRAGQGCFVLAFHSDVGAFALQLCADLESAGPPPSS
jgi:chemotaxis protein CheX